MTNIEKLNRWFNDEKKAKGLVDIKLCPGNISQSSKETFAGSILGILESRRQNKRTKIKNL